MRKTDNGQINKWGTTISTTIKVDWGTQNRGASGCDIQTYIIKLDGKKQMQADVVLVYKWGMDWMIIHNH